MNIGEWSEPYVFFKLLADGVLFAADAQLKKNDHLKFQVICVDGFDSNGDKAQYFIEADKIKRLAVNSDAEVFKRQDFFDHARIILNNITAKELPVVQNFLKSIKVTKLAPAKDKADITVTLQDPQVLQAKENAFSVKSYLGGLPTLFNASHATNITFQLLGDGKAIEEISGKDYKVSALCKHLHDAGITYNLAYYDSSALAANLKMIDAAMPQIYAEAVALSYFTGIKSLAKISAELEVVDPIHFNSPVHKFYHHKLKSLLFAIALGMVPRTPWLGDVQANGGFIIVRVDGELVCYHLYNFNDFRAYLLNHTCFDTPSTSRHGFGKIFKADDQFYLTLNAQIRFIKHKTEQADDPLF